MSKGLTAFANLIKQLSSPVNLHLNGKSFKASMGMEIGVIRTLVLAPLLMPAYAPCPIMNSLAQPCPGERSRPRNHQ
jgi:hypothetical protein